MKNLLKIIFILMLSVNCKAQSLVIDLKEQNGKPLQDEYAKDLYNVLDPFVGTYLYTSGNTSIKIELRKVIMAYSGYRYEDLLIGEYRYIKNGIPKVDTLYELDGWSEIEQKHTLHANYPLKMGDYLCQGCVASEIRILGGFVDHLTNNHAQIIISKTLVGLQQAIKINFYWRTGTYIEGTTPVYPLLPGGDIIFIKQ